MDERIYRPGERINTYEVLRHLATGTEAALYAARNLDPDAEHRHPVALKVCRFAPESMSQDEVERFNDRLEREYKLLLPLWHRNLVHVFGLEYEGGLAFCVMELLEGPTLGTWLSQERRTFQEAMLVYRQLVGALRYAHRRGRVHRDLKPSNVLVVPKRKRPRGVVDWDPPFDPGEEDAAPFLLQAKAQAVLVDFGTAHGLSSAPLTLPGALSGTAEYLTPEYARHVLAESDTPFRGTPMQDVYQLGLLLYQVLTGRHPVRTPAAQWMKLLHELAEQSPPDPREVNPDAPAALSSLAMACLAKHPNQRPRDAARLMERLIEAMRQDAAKLAQWAPQPGELPDTTVAQRSKGGVQRRKAERERSATRRGQRNLGAGAFAGVVLGSVVTLGAVAWSRATERRPTHESERASVPTNVPPASTAITTGLPMPRTPDPRWIKAAKDCGYGTLERCVWNGAKLANVIGYRGAYWHTFKNRAWKAEAPQKCMGSAALYDPPSDAPAELQPLCFAPLEKSDLPNAVEPNQEQ